MRGSSLASLHILRRASPALALTILSAISIIGFVDRIIMNVLVEPIKAEFGLTDTQIGMVNGLAFAALNIILGLVVARYAERSRRLTLVAIGTLLWSVATALTGMAGSFIQLVLARVGVGVGEAVGLPTTSSIISDYFPKQKRATAMSILHLSPPIGAFLGAAGGSLIAQAWGWQYALYAAAAPGLLLAVLLHLFVAEPVRGQHDDVSDKASVPPMKEVITRYWLRPTMRHFLAGSAIASMVGFGLNAFLAAYLSRRFGFTLVEAGLTSGIVASLPAAVSVAGSGWLSDRWAKRDQRSYAFIPAVSLLISTPLYLLAITRESPAAAITLLGIAALVQYCYLGPTFGTFQNMLHPRMRATGSAFTSLVYALIGGGIGPLLLGGLSDWFTGHAPSPGVGLGWAMGGFSIFYLWAALHYFIAARHIRGDLEKPLES
jgi:MFS family permease